MTIKETALTVFDTTKAYVYGTAGATLVGKLIAGQAIYGVVLIPATATYLSLAQTAVMATLVVTVALCIADFVLGMNEEGKNMFFWKNSFAGLLTLYGMHHVSLFTGVHPIGLFALIVIRVATNFGLTNLHNEWIWPRGITNLNLTMKYILPNNAV